jgi:hypothetical protein
MDLALARTSGSAPSPLGGVNRSNATRRQRRSAQLPAAGGVLLLGVGGVIRAGASAALRPERGNGELERSRSARRVP